MKYQGKESRDRRTTYCCDPSGRHWNEVFAGIESAKDGTNDGLAFRNEITSLFRRLWNVNTPAHGKYIGASEGSRDVRSAEG